MKDSSSSRSMNPHSAQGTASSEANLGFASNNEASFSMGVTIPGTVSQQQYTFPEPITWEPPVRHGEGSWSISSADGLFYVHKVQTRTLVDYTCWKRKAGPLGLNRRLGCVETTGEAIALCEAAR